MAEDGEQEVDRAHGVFLIFARDTLCNAHDTLHLTAALDRLNHSDGLFGHERVVDVLESSFGIHARLHEEVVCHTLFEAHDSQQEVLGGYERALRALGFVASEQ